MGWGTYGRAYMPRVKKENFEDKIKSLEEDINRIKTQIILLLKTNITTVENVETQQIELDRLFENLEETIGNQAIMLSMLAWTEDDQWEEA